jgi:hypothetical protein
MRQKNSFQVEIIGCVGQEATKPRFIAHFRGSRARQVTTQ